MNRAKILSRTYLSMRNASKWKIISEILNTSNDLATTILDIYTYINVKRISSCVVSCSPGVQHIKANRCG